MATKEWFAILPYLKTSEPIQVRGIQFRSSDDVEGLPEESKNHLKVLTSLFFLKDSLRILKMTYARIEIEDGEEKSQALFRQMREAKVLIGYLYSSPDQRGRAFLTHEHSDLYLFTPEMVSRFVISPEHGVENLDDSNHTSPENNMTPGYEGYINFNSMLWVIEGCRIYPPSREFWLNISQNLHYDMGLTLSQRHNWALEDLFRERISKSLIIRIFTAMEWYNRSSSISIREDVALLHLAVALECLLQIEPGEKLTERFKETILTLLGSVPRLDSWIDQFYKARSKIVHEGSWPHLHFYAVEREHFPKVLAKKYSGTEYRPLTNYGRIVFRLSLKSILSGLKLTEDYDLASFFFHNQERLNKICSVIGEDKVEPRKRILDASQDIFNLHEYIWESDINLESLIGTTNLIIRSYLLITPSIPEEILNQMNTAIQNNSDVSLREKFDKLELLVKAIHNWKGTGYLKGDITTLDPFNVVWSLLEFAVSPKFMLQAYTT